MPYLIAQGRETRHRWRRTLPAGGSFILGRTAGAWSVPWDGQISRSHVELAWHEGVLSVRKLDAARNPVFYRGRVLNGFDVHPNEHFVIGETTFKLANEEVTVSQDLPSPRREQSFSAEYLRGLRFRHADDRINLLGQLPDLIAGATSEGELTSRLVSLLLEGIPRAESVAIVQIDSREPASPARVAHWDGRGEDLKEFSPSDRLIREAIQRGESVVHVWGHRSASDGEFTALSGVDWAFCTPLMGESESGGCLYVAGRFTMRVPQGTPTDPEDLRDDVKFTELVASTFSALRDLSVLQRRQAGLSQFFSPRVMDALADHDPDQVLLPRETEVTVLFCDLRGFSRHSQLEADHLMGLLERVSRALGITTHQVLDQGGVIGDFHGDAVMGFWGWPLPQADAVARACRAALAIRRDLAALAAKKDNPLADFRMGLGIATGKAVAGKIGTVDQVKVTAFGPVVNLASRLEGMTKTFRVPILVDEVTAERGRLQIGGDVARFRRLAVVRPAGMDAIVAITELLPPVSEYPQLSDEHIHSYERALEQWSLGEWEESFRLLHDVPATDLAKDFLTVYIAQHQRTPPAGWDGSIHVTEK
jgi:adenylate cyclase